MTETNWVMVGLGIILILMGASLIIILPIEGKNIVAIGIIILTGLGLTVAGSPDPRDDDADAL